MFGLKEAFCSVSKTISQFSPDSKCWLYIVGELDPSNVQYSRLLQSQLHKLAVFHQKHGKSNRSLAAERRPPPLFFFTFFPHFAAYVSSQWWWCVLRVCMLLPAWAELAGEGRTDYHFPQCVYCWGPGGDSSVAATSARLELSEPLRSCLRHPQQPTLLPLRHAQMSRLFQYVWLHMRMP